MCIGPVGLAETYSTLIFSRAPIAERPKSLPRCKTWRSASSHAAGLSVEFELADLLSVEDVAAVADAMEPGSTAGLLVYENLWAAPFASAVRRAGGQLISNGRIPVQALLAVLEAEAAEDPPPPPLHSTDNE